MVCCGDLCGFILPFDPCHDTLSVKTTILANPDHGKVAVLDPRPAIKPA